MKIRKASESDLPAITRIQGECYSEHFIESADSFSAKLSAHSEFSFIAVQGELAVGYVISLPWVFGDIPKLNGLECAIPRNPDGLYIHDIAVSPVARKGGVAEQLLNSVLEAGRSKGYGQVFLVAIAGASSYWRRHGFEAVNVNDDLRRRLSTYGEGRPTWRGPSLGSDRLRRSNRSIAVPTAKSFIPASGIWMDVELPANRPSAQPPHPGALGETTARRCRIQNSGMGGAGRVLSG